MQAVESIEQERQIILRRYRDIFRSETGRTFTKADKKLIRKAFEYSMEAHQGGRRKSGEPYILHPLAVAKIVSTEIGLDTTSIVCALLHDVVEDTFAEPEDVQREFGNTVAKIIDGLTKISGLFDQKSSLQAENFRKMLLTMSDDIRVILIKLADRLHNMRTLEHVPRETQLKISSETLYLYAPLANRLGLYNIKTELEDLALRYTDRAAYDEIENKLAEGKQERTRFIHEFTKPIRTALDKTNLKYEILGRTKSIYSIYNKMKKQNIPFEQVYDIFAVRIIMESPEHREKEDCWRAYSIVSDLYTPNPDRLRDWISTPKSNGYEALHTTVMGQNGKWIEVQIRSRRMHEIAEKGLAAHWKYKEKTKDGTLDEWLTKVREMLENPQSNALDFLDDFKLNLFSDEIFVFTPNGDLKKLPANSTALDFAFDIHTQVGLHCIGAKVNNRLVPLSHKLSNGDQVEILTSQKQTPHEDWMRFVVTAKSKGKIKETLKEEKKKVAETGEKAFVKKLKQLNLERSQEIINKTLAHFKIPSALELFYLVGSNKFDLNRLKEITEERPPEKILAEETSQENVDTLLKKYRGAQADMLMIGENLSNIQYGLAQCCQPIPGDDILGFVTINEGIKIHRTKCPNAISLMSNYGYRIIKAKWNEKRNVAFLAGVRITGEDKVGMMNSLTKIISKEMKVNIRGVTIDTKDGMFDGILMLYVQDTAQLNNLMKKLGTVGGVFSVTRYDKA